MTKTIAVAGLQLVLTRLQPYLKSILDGTVKLADGMILHIPDASTLSFSEGGDPDTVLVGFNGMKLEIHKLFLLGLFNFSGTEPVGTLAVGASQIETQISAFNVRLVDG